MSAFPEGADRDGPEEAEAVPARPDAAGDQPAGAGPEAPGEGGDEAGGEGEALARLATERDEYLDALRRLQAEFDNFRKRTSRQQAELADRAGEALLERLLPVLDAFDLALQHHAGPGGDAGEGVGAFGQIATLLRDQLAKDGLERIDAVGVGFDPSIHDAVAHRPAEAPGEEAAGASQDDGAPGAVVTEVLRAGYRLKGRVLRPAMVAVQG